MKKRIIHTDIDQEAQELRRMRTFISLSSTEWLREAFGLMKLNMSLEPFLHINQLLYSKRQSNGPKDQIDVQALEKVLK